MLPDPAEGSDSRNHSRSVCPRRRRHLPWTVGTQSLCQALDQNAQKCRLSSSCQRGKQPEELWPRLTQRNHPARRRLREVWFGPEISASYIRKSSCCRMKAGTDGDLMVQLMSQFKYRGKKLLVGLPVQFPPCSPPITTQNSGAFSIVPLFRPCSSSGGWRRTTSGTILAKKKHGYCSKSYHCTFSLFFSLHRVTRTQSITRATLTIKSDNCHLTPDKVPTATAQTTVVLTTV